MRYLVFINQTEVVSVRSCYSVRTNGEGWFRMHPPMHALYHLPNLVPHPTPGPTSKPTPWRTWASKQAAFGQQRARAAGLFVPGFSEAGFDQADTPPHCPAPPKLSSAPLDTIMKHCSMHAHASQIILHRCHRLCSGISGNLIFTSMAFSPHTCS